jgi:hypothetical protein
MRIVERNWDLYDMAHSILDTEHLSPLKQKELHYSFLTSYTARQPRWQSSLEYPRGPKLVYASGH